MLQEFGVPPEIENAVMIVLFIIILYFFGPWKVGGGSHHQDQEDLGDAQRRNAYRDRYKPEHEVDPHVRGRGSPFDN